MTWLRDHLRTAPRPEPAAARQAWPVEVGETDAAVIVTVPPAGPEAERRRGVAA